MRPNRLRRTVIVAALLALLVPLTAGAGDATDGRDGKRFNERSRILFATDAPGNLLQLRAGNPRRVSSKEITGLPVGVSLKGIDFRPATGDLYALGSDKVVYRVNPRTAIAVSEGPAFESAPGALVGDRIGFDFNPTVDKIRVTSDPDDNLRLNPDEGNLLSTDTKLTPSGATVVGSAYTNSSFTAFATRPTVTEFYAWDIASSPDTLWIQRPANAGTLIMPLPVGVDLGSDVGFDIAGAANVGYVAGTVSGRDGAELRTVDLATGNTRSLGRIGRADVTITGLAAWQDN
jgi:Domain of unknown function (DUF4394)